MRQVLFCDFLKNKPVREEKDMDVMYRCYLA